MKNAVVSVLVTGFVSVLAAAFMSVAGAQAIKPVPLPASAPVPAASAASSPITVRNPAVRAAEAAKEPGKLVPEQRVIPQISIPLKNRNIPAETEPAASATPGSVPGAVNDGTARCLAARDAKARAACERGQAASAPKGMGR